MSEDVKQSCRVSIEMLTICLMERLVIIIYLSI